MTSRGQSCRATDGGPHPRTGAAAWAQDPRGRDSEGGARQIALKKTDVACAVAATGRFSVSVVAQTLGVSRPNRHARLTGSAKSRRRYHKAQDTTVVPLITALVAARPTYGYRRITAILNRQLRVTSASPVNHKRVYPLANRRLQRNLPRGASCRGRACCWRGTTLSDPTASTTARS